MERLREQTAAEMATPPGTVPVIAQKPVYTPSRSRTKPPDQAFPDEPVITLEDE